MVSIAQRGSMGKRPDHVVLTGSLPDAARHLIDVDKVGVLSSRALGRQKHIEPLDEVHDIAQLIARLKAPEWILLRHEEAEHDRKELALGINSSCAASVGGSRKKALPMTVRRGMCTIWKSYCAACSDGMCGNESKLFSKSRTGIGCHLEVDGRPIAGAVMQGKKSRRDFRGRPRRRLWLRRALGRHLVEPLREIGLHGAAKSRV
jgi:hypothetical protein